MSKLLIATCVHLLNLTSFLVDVSTKWLDIETISWDSVVLMIRTSKLIVFYEKVLFGKTSFRKAQQVLQKLPHFEVELLENVVWLKKNMLQVFLKFLKKYWMKN